MKKRLNDKLTVMITIVLTAAVTGLSACGSKAPAETTTAQATAETSAAQATAETTSAKGADSDWYMKALNDASLMEQYPYHAFADVNGDGVPVLFLSSTEKAFIGGEDKACMMVYDNNQPKTLKEIGGAGGEKFYCSAEEHTITWYSRLSGEGHIEVYELKDGELNKITDAATYAPHHHPEKDNAEQLYLQDGKEITEEASDALWEKYAADADEISYVK